MSVKWKNSFVIPTPKTGTTKCEEYRPVNMLPTYEKVLEGIVKLQFNEYTDSINIIITEQYGFRENHSCEMALNSVILDWKVEIDSGNAVIAVFLDLKTAFETVIRCKLVE